MNNLFTVAIGMNNLIQLQLLATVTPLNMCNDIMNTCYAPGPASCADKIHRLPVILHKIHPFCKLFGCHEMFTQWDVVYFYRFTCCISARV